MQADRTFTETNNKQETKDKHPFQQRRAQTVSSYFIQEYSRSDDESAFEFKFNCKNIIRLMYLSNNNLYPCETFKEDNQTCTEASSQLAIDKHSVQESKQDSNPDEELRRCEAKLKYRKLKQKLNSMGFQHDDKCLITKELSSTKKQRIMKLALDLEKQTKIQNRDYEAIEIAAREISKIVEIKKEQDLHLLRQSRFIPALFELLTKVPSLHKVQFGQLVRGLELCFRILHSFTSVSANRDYLILTNRLNGLISFGSWILGRQEKKAWTQHYLSVQRITFKLINSLLLHKSKQQDIQSITDTTVELILCSQIFKKLKITLCEQLIQEDTVTETDTILELLRFMLHVMRRASPKLNYDYSASNQNGKEQSKLGYLCKLVEFVAPFLLSFFHQLKETETTPEGQFTPESYPIVIESSLGLIVKILNCCCEGALPSFKKAVTDLKCESLISSFVTASCTMIRYCKREMEEYNDSPHAKSLLNELIILLGYLSREDGAVQKKLYDSGLLEEIFNLPVHYIMDSYLRQVYIPTFCCLINDNKSNLNLFLKDNSPQPIIKALKKQMAAHLITRKASTTSLVSIAHISGEYTSANYQTDRIAMQNRFPMVYWQSLCWQLQKHV